MNGHAIAEELAKAFFGRAMNEANTRHQIIDPLLHDILGWPRSSVRVEEKVHPGFSDYVLRDRADRVVLLIEAKKEGQYFALPAKIAKRKQDHHFVRLRTLMTDKSTAAAVRQAAEYCPALGCEFACVTNGHEFIVFRAFVRGRDFADADALVIASLVFFSDSYIQAHNLLSYDAVVAEQSLQREIQSRRHSGRELYYPKSGIAHYDAPVAKNPFAKYLDPLARRYFGDIAPTDARMMKHCYVFARGTEEVEKSMKGRLCDSLTPYFLADGAKEVVDYRSGGHLAKHIAASLKHIEGGDVVILYGGKGAGKSTFLRKVLYHEPPLEFQLHAFPVIADCLSAPQQKTELTAHVWDQVITALDQNRVLSAPLEALVTLFEDRFAVAQVQDLAGYEPGSMDYIRERNRLVLEWRRDSPYVAKRLRQYWERKGKILVLAIDNTDHLPAMLQDHCFLLAKTIARELACVVVISMREERYCRARTAGVLDAYHNRGFHLAAPDLSGVFAKRLGLLISDLNQNTHKHLHAVIPPDAPYEQLARFFSVALRQFRDPDNALRRFLYECSRDNTRIALDFFTQFASSGYTHVEEMISKKNWTVIGHQVIKPMMVPERFNYDENKSLIPNLFQCRTSTRGSHFTMLRILASLRRGLTTSPERGGYTRVDALLDDFESRFAMRADCEAALDVMLNHGLLEASNRLDCYRVEKAGTDGREFIHADEVRITAFGVYALDHLSCCFAYVDLVSLDCGLTEESLCNEFCTMALRERAIGTRGDKKSRLDSRLARSRLFMQYLRREEDRERAEFLLEDSEALIDAIEQAFSEDCERVESSAERTFAKGQDVEPAEQPDGAVTQEPALSAVP